MFAWLCRRVFGSGLLSQRGLASLEKLDDLARSGAAAWLLAQERARLAFLAAKEQYEARGSWSDLGTLFTQFIQLHSTNAVVASLLNEHAAERLLAAGQTCRQPEAPPLRKSA